MTRWERSESQTGEHGAAWATYLDEWTAWWLALVAQTEGVRAAGRRAAHACVRVAGVDPDGLALTVPSAGGVSRATGVNRADIVRGLAELQAAGLVVHRAGLVVLVGGDQ